MVRRRLDRPLALVHVCAHTFDTERTIVRDRSVDCARVVHERARALMQLADVPQLQTRRRRAHCGRQPHDADDRRGLVHREAQAIRRSLDTRAVDEHIPSARTAELITESRSSRDQHARWRRRNLQQLAGQRQHESRTAVVASPSAHSTPGPGGMIDGHEPSKRDNALAWIGPAPPKAMSA